MRFSVSQTKEFTDFVNELISDLDVSGPDLGEAFHKLSYDECQDALIKYRIRKKFQVPDDCTSRDRADNTVAAMFKYDSEGLTSFSFNSLPKEIRSVLSQARVNIHENFRDYRLNFSNIVLPTGETSISKGGDVSIYAKLCDPRQWAVTADCFELAASVIYKTRYLKLIAKRHMPRYSKRDNDLLWFSFSESKKPGFEIFKCKLLDFITIVEGSRVTTVPKNNQVDRCINCEPLFNMVVQSCISSSIRRTVIRDRLGVDLESAQPQHVKRLRFSRFATIDLSAASDSNWMCVARWLYPKRFMRHIESARSPVGTYKGVKHAFNMVSPMGNGFTFELMTSTILHIARVLDPHARVFGDDIIISNEHALLLVDVLTAIGYRINESKTFINSTFRESCGGFFKDDGDKSGYLRSYDFKYSNNIVETFVLVNKMIRLSKFTDIFNTALEQIFQRCSLLWCSYSHKEDLHGAYIEKDMRRLKHKDPEVQRVRKRNVKHFQDMILRYQLNMHKVDFFYSYELKCMNYIELKRWKRLPSYVTNTFLIGTWLYTGRCDAPLTRETRVSRTVSFN